MYNNVDNDFFDKRYMDDNHYCAINSFGEDNLCHSKYRELDERGIKAGCSELCFAYQKKEVI